MDIRLDENKILPVYTGFGNIWDNKKIAIQKIAIFSVPRTIFENGNFSQFANN